MWFDAASLGFHTDKRIRSPKIVRCTVSLLNPFSPLHSKCLCHSLKTSRMQPICKMNLLGIWFHSVTRWVWGLAIGVPVAAALAYILFGPDTEVLTRKNILSKFATVCFYTLILISLISSKMIRICSGGWREEKERQEGKRRSKRGGEGGKEVSPHSCQSKSKTIFY